MQRQITRKLNLLRRLIGDRFHHIEHIGEGGSAFVFRAYDSVLSRTVAIKVFRRKRRRNRRSRFFHEAVMTAPFAGHAFIMPIFDCVTDGPLDFYIMPFYPDQTLEAKIAAEGCLDIDLCARFLHNLATALGAIHRSGVIHRDIKADNVLIEQNNAILCDFGVASRNGSNGKSRTLYNDWPYAAPEQRQPGGAEPRSDIFSLGVVAYHMLTNEFPYETPESTTPIPIENSRPQVPQELADIVMRCIAHDPDQRWQTAGDLEDAMDGILAMRARSANSLAASITGEQWDYLERRVRQAAVLGGVAAMGNYNSDVRRLSLAGNGKNPSTEADLEATVAVLMAIDPPLSAWQDDVGCRLRYLGEETVKAECLDGKLPADTLRKITKPEEFFSTCDRTIRVIVDGIDGTGCFTRHLGLFCTAVAVLIEDEPRVAALYDPIHQTVYSAVLATPADQTTTRATEINHSNGLVTDLIRETRRMERNPIPPNAEAYATHISRTKTARAHEVLETRGPARSSFLERLHYAGAATFALNSGLTAMIKVATGHFGGFVNRITNLWDVAAGEVLVRACGGAVTDFRGRPINYGIYHDTSLIAAKQGTYGYIRNIVDEWVGSN